MIALTNNVITYVANLHQRLGDGREYGNRSGSKPEKKISLFYSSLSSLSPILSPIVGNIPVRKLPTIIYSIRVFRDFKILAEKKLD